MDSAADEVRALSADMVMFVVVGLFGGVWRIVSEWREGSKWSGTCNAISVS